MRDSTAAAAAAPGGGSRWWEGLTTERSRGSLRKKPSLTADWRGDAPWGDRAPQHHRAAAAAANTEVTPCKFPRSCNSCRHPGGALPAGAACFVSFLSRIRNNPVKVIYWTITHTPMQQRAMATFLSVNVTDMNNEQQSSERWAASSPLLWIITTTTIFIITTTTTTIIIIIITIILLILHLSGFAGPSTSWLWAASAPEELGQGRRSWARASCREACCGATWATARWWDPATWRAASTTRRSWSTPRVCLETSLWWCGIVPAG